MPELLATVQEALGDRYQLAGELGHGGMAVVYRARDLRHSRDVAVKVFDPAFSSVVGAERFALEIAIAAKLQHPSIVTLLDSGRVGDVLYYIMPLVGGETLRERIERQAQLPVPEALAIVREVADALTYAHQQGIVHRDIKPENIMLSSGRAMVADFGIACSITPNESSRLTERGLAVGTPEYMSPEQAVGSDRVDGRSDVYSLACVLYEMLAGDPPFTGRTAQAILARHIHDPPPSLRVVRPAASVALQAALERALAKVPADRFATANEFSAALDLALSRPNRVPQAPRVWRWVAAAVATLAMVVLAWRSPWSSDMRGAKAGNTADTSHYLILPFEHVGGRAGTNEEQLLHDALAGWTGIIVVDAFLVRDAMTTTHGVLTSRDAQRAAVRLGAGRYLRGEVSRIGDSVRVHVTLFDAITGSPLRDQAIKLDPGLSGADSLFAGLAEALLFRDAQPAGRAALAAGTRSVPARQSFAGGQAAIERWDLAAADSAFVVAATFDPEYAQAQLWLAQVRSWKGEVSSRWQSPAERAAAARPRLSARDRQLADALVALARGDPPRACALWRGLTVRDRYDFTSWFSLGNCLSHDTVVIRDRASLSGWQFRSSYHEAITAYEHAFLLLPSMHRSLRDRSYRSVRRLFKTSHNALRPGWALAPDTATFAAYPEWRGDTLAFVPWPRSAVTAASFPASEATNAAVRHERTRFRNIALSWAANNPGSPDALEAVALSLEMLGDPAALDSLRRARSLAESPESRLRLAAEEVWTRVRRAAPDDIAGLRSAVVLADSVISNYPPGRAPEPFWAASLAALVGRANRAAAYGRQEEVAREFGLTGALAGAGYPLLIFAALGGPLDSIRVLERVVEEAIQRDVPGPDRLDARGTWQARAATLVFPEFRFASWQALTATGDYLLSAQVAETQGDTAPARGVLRQYAAARVRMSPADVTYDGLYPETRLLLAMGDVAGATAWLDPGLEALRSTEPSAFDDPVQAGTLVRSMALRAELAQRAGDRRGAARWASAVLVVWANAEPFAEPVLRRMRELAR